MEPRLYRWWRYFNFMQAKGIRARLDLEGQIFAGNL